MLARQRVIERERLPGKDRSTEVRATEITVCDRRRTEKHRRGRGVASRESRRESYGDVELEEVERTIVEPHRLIDDNEGGRMRTLREIIVHYSPLAPIGSGIIYMKRRKDADEHVLTACDRRTVVHTGVRHCIRQGQI